MSTIEYRLRTVKRFIVTRYERPDPDYVSGAIRAAVSSQKGEYDNEDSAYQVAYALCKNEHEQLGYPAGDERVKYPEPAATSTTIRALKTA